MIIDNRFRIAALCAVLAFAGGCRTLTGKTCNAPQAYSGSREMAPVKIPTGLKGLDTRRAVRIPDLACAALDVAVRIPAPRGGFCFWANPAEIHSDGPHGAAASWWHG
mgnify:CR=1 FL=1